MTATAEYYRLMAQYACWICGAHPEALVEVTTFRDPKPVYLAGGWVRTGLIDHEHATNPPSPEDLAAAGRAALQRILEA